MERARALAKELPALWEQHRLLAEQVEGFGEPVLRAEQAVELAARELDRLTNLRIDGLRAEVTEALRAATASQARVTEQVGRRQEEITSLERTTAALATELAGLDERAGQLTAEHKDLQERLSLRLAANQRVATSLTGLREVELQLAGAEATLGAALRDRQEALRVNRERRFPGDGI
jgi:chromosome segregation ATPase